jgi:hypothetical protein
LAQIGKCKKPTVGFLGAFFAKKRVFICFLGTLKASGLQPAENEAFTGEGKTRHLYDKTDFPGGAAGGHSSRKLNGIKGIGTKDVRPTERQV